MKIRNFRELAVTDLRKAALEIAEAGLQAIDTEKYIKKEVSLKGNILTVKDKEFDLAPFERVFFVGVGKCALEAGRAFESILGKKLSGGIVLDVHEGKLGKIKTFAGAHPFPEPRNIDATAEIIELLSLLTEKDFVVFVISGGGSTLLCQPKELVCQDEKDILQALFRAGANIEETNTVRKHLSLARGGHLAAYAHPATSVALIFSDVRGSIEFVASGPTVKDTTTVTDARRILDKYGIEKETGLKIEPLETPKEEKFFEKITNISFLDNMTSLAAMSEKARELGFDAHIHTNVLEGEARDRGKEIAGNLHEHKGSKKIAILYGGETTVSVKGKGKGGRNQELVMGALGEMKEGELIVSLASDGRDNTDFAGALCDSITTEKIAKLGLKPEEFLKNNDSYRFFEKVGDYILTGDTGSNVSDLVIAVKEQ
jgi:glycerate-2-kinase